MYKDFNSNDYAFLHKYMQNSSTVHLHGTRRANELRLPRYARSKTQCSFLYAAINRWNSSTLRMSVDTSLNNFKRGIVVFYIDTY